MKLGAFSVRTSLPFNPGWDGDAQGVDAFARPASFMAVDPDGNTILVD